MKSHFFFKTFGDVGVVVATSAVVGVYDIEDGAGVCIMLNDGKSFRTGTYDLPGFAEAVLGDSQLSVEVHG